MNATLPVSLLAEEHRHLSAADRIVAGTALFIILNGILTCIGWWDHIPILVQLGSDDAPTQFMSALSFVLLGVGELGMVTRHRRLVFTTAGIVIFLATVEWAQYAFHTNTRLDTLLATPFVGLGAPHPESLPGNTVACLLLICGAQVLMSKPHSEAGPSTTAAVVMKTLAGGIAFVALLGYLTDVKGAYGWTDSAGMSLRSLAGFLLLVAARIAALWQRDIVAKPALPNWFLPFLTVAAVTISVGLIWVSTSVASALVHDVDHVAGARGLSAAIIVSVSALIVLGAMSVLVARHKATMALQQAADLSVKRTEVERALRANNKRLARSNRDLEDFAYVASHDLRAPLSGIDSAAKWLTQDLHEGLSDESKKLLGLMRNRINRMEKLLDDLLAYSRAGRVDTAINQTNVSDMFENIVAILSPPAHIRVRVEGLLPVIVTASAQLEQVLRNLINNAIKHHDKGSGEVVLSAKRVGDLIEFKVRDDGPGILPQFHERIFVLFQTLKRRDEVEGSGMGLALVKKLVEQQNCSISVHSQGNGTGTEFSFQWPTSPVTSHAQEMTNA